MELVLVFITLVTFKTQCIPSLAFSNVVVTGNEGLIVGEVVEQSAIFWGVPFAKPPVGNLRWTSPRYPSPYEGKYWNATYARPGCPETCDTRRKYYVCAKTFSEDCLYLNVFLPRRILEKRNESGRIEGGHFIVQDEVINSVSNSLAVVVYIHGGNFRYSSGSALLYDGRFLANRGDIIVVTINYRLNAIGFFAQGDDNVVNFGILDQMQSLKWLKKNIAFFGGNPHKITVIGQSAGAESIGILMSTPRAKGLFQQAIFHSNPWSLPYRTLPQARKLGDKLAKKVGCRPRNMTCLRKVPVSQIIEAGNKLFAPDILHGEKILLAFQPWGPIIDGDLVERLPFYSFVQGKFHKIPVIMGNDKNDGALFVAMAFRKPVGKATYDTIVNFIMGRLGENLIQQYPAPCDSCDHRKDLSEITTDYAFLCPTRQALMKSSKNSWGFMFDANLPLKGLFMNDMCIKEVCHGSEITYLFDTVLLTNFTFNELEQELSRKLQTYWSNFAKHGNPNGMNSEVDGISLEHWDQFTNSDTHSYKILKMRKEGNVMMKDPFKNLCDYWDKTEAYGKY